MMENEEVVSECIDKMIISLCEYTEKIIKSDKVLSESEKVAQNTKALAKLLSARALWNND